MLTITVIDRPSSFEVKIARDGIHVESCCATYRQDLKRYYPSVDEAIALLDRYKQSGEPFQFISVSR